MEQQLSGVRWHRVGITVAVALVLVLAATTAIDAWRRRDGWCVQYFPDGSDKTLYGAECRMTK